MSEDKTAAAGSFRFVNIAANGGIEGAVEEFADGHGIILTWGKGVRSIERSASPSRSARLDNGRRLSLYRPC